MSSRRRYPSRPAASNDAAGREALSSEAYGPDAETGALTERSARIVAAHKLLRRAGRRKAREFLADGPQAVREAIAAERERPGTVLELYITAAGSAHHTAIVRAAFDVGIAVTQITDNAAARISDALTPQGLTARCALPDTTFAPGRVPPHAEIIAVLVETSDPGNAGTVIRVADAAGADAVITAGHTVDPFGPKAARASAGSIFHLPVLRADDPHELVNELRDAGLAVLATTGHADLDLDAAREQGLLARPTAWLFGSEAHGLADDVIPAADAAVKVPIYGRAESLNLATAAAICLYASAAAQRGT